MRVARRFIDLAVATCLLVGLLCQARGGEVIKFAPEQKGLAAVTDPAASEKRAVAVNLTTESGSVILASIKKPLAPGRYNFAPRLRLLLPAEYDRSRLKLTLSFLVEGKPLAQKPLNWLHFNERAGAYTEFDQQISFTKPSALAVELSWSIAPLPVGEKPRPVTPIKGPSIDEATPKLALKGKKGASDLLDDIVSDLQADQALPLSSITYPAVLADRMSVSAASTTLAIEKVWPEKVHVYPGEANPIEVTVRNFEGRPAMAVVRLEIRTGFDQTSPPLEATVDVPARGTAKHRFSWTSDKVSFGHEARAAVLSASQPVHSASEYFSVGAPIWKTALQGSGFLTWFGREFQFPEHVESNRRNYINVEEAFSWQPSSWTDLNPTTEDWWTGQGNAHNSLRGLREWMDLSHREGIKLITYSWPSASGPSGIEWGRRHPELVTHVAVGLASEFHDVEDLKLYDLLHTNPAYKGLQYGVWHGFGINLGYLKTIDLGATEIVKSAKNFGWDGVRFDSPPGWSAMGAAETHAEMQQMGVADRVAALVPEYMSVNTGNWDGEAISIRNIRWLRHRFQTEIDPHFAISYNYGINVDPSDTAARPPAFYRECSREGGQIMHEAIRLSSSWEAYRKTALTQAELARQNGAYHTVFCPDRAPAWGRNFAAIFTFAAGSHPYLNYGWGPTMAGAYSQFMTRYGEYCWDLALAPVSAADVGLTVKSDAALLWQDYARQRRLADGSLQTVLHLISPPPVDTVVPAGKIGTLVPWQKDIVISKKGTVKPVVWLLSAEPTTHAEQLTARPAGDGFAVTVLEHRYWTVLVWTEGKP
jgi:hypothetical protein